ncbi:MAG: NADH-quinone oxidoreductase subunit N [Bacteroidetes bacterium]|nr:NADH-quinone oxidoreductase subunit N [Bacteroidota bacterium]
MLPFIALAVLGIVLLYAGLTKNNRLLVPIAVAGLLVTLGFTLKAWDSLVAYYNRMALIDNFSIAFNTVAIISTILILLLSVFYYKNVKEHVAEVYALMLFSLFGGFLMTGYTNLVLLFIGIETLSIPLYVLAGSKKSSLRSNEASFKYFLMGAFSSAILLMGIALIYGAVGSFHLATIPVLIKKTYGFILGTPGVYPGILHIGILLVLVGFAFKVAAVPFHFWTPDVYEGSPTIVTIFMATVVKTLGFAAFYRFFATFGPIDTIWKDILWVIIVLTLLVGNLGALNQKGTKRMLAYSSISHSGFMLIAIIAINKLSAGSLLFYSMAYSFATIAAFGVLISIKNYLQQSDNLAIFNGLAKKNPLLALIMTIALLSMAGIPVTAGFFAKYYIFVNAVSQGYVWLTLIGIAAALIGVYYYFRIIVAMYFKEGDSTLPKVEVQPLFLATLLFVTFMTLAMGLFPGWFIDLI